MKYQQGSTLIMVLIVVLLISIIATIALKDSIFGLRLSTNNQVDNLLLENSDVALFNLEDPAQVSKRLATHDIYGYFTQAANADDTLVFCYDASRTEFFDLTKASVLSKGKLGPYGYCQPNQFSDGRQAVISQIYIHRVATIGNNNTPFEGVPTGNDIGVNALGVPAMRLSATSISILPSFANTNNGQTITNCFNSNDIPSAVTCLRNMNAPYNLQQSEYLILTKPNNTSHK